MATNGRDLSGTNQETRDPLAAWWRVTLVLIATLLLPLALLAWIGFALLWFGFRQGENVLCHCWADNHDAWQYSGQFIVAAIGFIAGAVAVTMLLRRAWRLLPETAPPSLGMTIAASTVAIAALSSWVAFYVTGTGT